MDPSQVLPVWQVARDALPASGRWPVCIWDSDEAREIADPGDPAAAAAELAEAAAHADPGAVASGWINDFPETLADLETFVQHRFPNHPDLAQRVIDDLGDPTTQPAFDRWLYEALLNEPALRSEVDVDYLRGTRQWFQPKRVTLALLPTDQGWLSPAWLSFHSFEMPEREAALAAAQRDWSRKYGAEIVANWGTMLQFLVGRPPTDPWDAYDLAGQLKDVGGSLQMYRYELALALPRSNAWFLHDRP